MTSHNPHTHGALCYPLGALFGPVPLVIVLLFAKNPFTKRCAAQALCAFSGLLAASLLGLLLLLLGVAIELLTHGTASLSSPSAPPIVVAGSVACGLLVCGTYGIQILSSVFLAVRASHGRLTLFPILGAAVDRSVDRYNSSQYPARYENA